jgi:hypothetical protein
MRIRPVYVVIVIIFAIGGFVLYAALGGDPGEGTAPSPATPANTGMLPPVDADQDRVPVLEVETDTFDMGTVPNTGPATQEMTIKNTGSEKLVIREISTSCGCTTGDITPREIMPGQSGKLEITAYPYRIPGFYSHKRLTLITNAPNAPMQNIDVIVRIEPEFEVVPEDGLDFGDVEKGQRVQREVLLRQLGEERVEVLDVKMIDEESRGVTFAWNVRPESEWKESGKPECAITATLEPFAPPGEFSQMCYIVTSCKRVPRYRYAIKGAVKSFYELSKDRLVFSVRPGQSGEAPLASLDVKADRPIEIVNPEITGESFSLKVVAGDTPNTMTVQLFMVSNKSSGRINEQLTFLVKAGGGEPLPNTVPVRAMVMNVR